MKTTDPVAQMFEVLVRSVRTSSPALLTSSFSVRDIHQQILPYRHFRRELGLDSNQEYELTLMRLLSGERGYLDVDERLRDALSAELASGSPDPGRLRDFADAQVSIKPSALGAAANAARTPATAAAPIAKDTECRYCAGALPHGQRVNFCPHCGQNLNVSHCPACGAELEAGWKFCAACGKGVR